MKLKSTRTDDELALQAQGGDNEAALILVDRYWDALHAIAFDFPIRGLDKEDAHEIALEGFSVAIRTFKIGAGAKFSTWFRRVVKRRLIDAYRSANLVKRRPAGVQLSLDEPIEEEGNNVITLEEIVPDMNPNPFERVSSRAEVDSALAEIFDLQRIILQQIGDGYSFPEIAQNVGLLCADLTGFIGVIKKLATGKKRAKLQAIRINLQRFMDEQGLSAEDVETLTDAPLGSISGFLDGKQTGSIKPYIATLAQLANFELSYFTAKPSTLFEDCHVSATA